MFSVCHDYLYTSPERLYLQSNGAVSVGQQMWPHVAAMHGKRTVLTGLYKQIVCTTFYTAEYQRAVYLHRSQLGCQTELVGLRKQLYIWVW